MNTTAPANLAGTPAADRKKRARLLRVSSILLILAGIVTLISCALTLLAIEYLSESLSETIVSEGSANELATAWLVVMVSIVLSVVQGVLSIASGIMGRKFARGGNDHLSMPCQTMAIVMVGLGIVSTLAQGIVSSFNIYLVGPFLLAEILPVTYYFGARRISTSTFWQGIRGPLDTSAAAHEEPFTCKRTSYAFDRTFSVATDAAVPLLHVIDLPTFTTEHPLEARSSIPTGSIQHSCVYSDYDRACGTLAVPKNDGIFASREPMRGAFLLDGGSLTLACADEDFHAAIQDYLADASFMHDDVTAVHVLHGFIAYLIQDDALYLADQEQRLDALEDGMLDDVTEIPSDFDHFVNQTRRLMRSLYGFYRQLSDLARALEASDFSLLGDRERRAFAALGDRSERLADDAHELNEYATHIKDLYQQKIDVRMNKVMSTLTIVTTIFMPLTLITGWYGMNFEVMPELHFGISYFVVIALAIVLVTAEVVIFKRKKWF